VNPREFLDIDPRTLRLPWSRRNGPDPLKWARQLSRFGYSTQGMAPLLVYRCKDGELLIYEGVTRANRVAKLLPGQTVRVEVIANHLSADVSKHPTVAEKLP
jgi:hypothetical protein